MVRHCPRLSGNFDQDNKIIPFLTLFVVVVDDVFVGGVVEGASTWGGC